MPQLYTIHQLRFLSNTILHALSTRPLTDTRPDNAEHRYKITASSPGSPAPTSTTIPETRRMLALCPGHTGLDLPMTGILITQVQLETWQERASGTRQVSLYKAVQKVRQAKLNGLKLPLLWHPMHHPTEGWVCITNPGFANTARTACLELLNVTLEAGNVRRVGKNEKSIGNIASSTTQAP